ncbi:multiple epidermal growth factor-like domains protein 9 [Pholidichthys leucotaenia]
MSSTSLMMNISPLLLFVFYVYGGFSDALPHSAPSDDASSPVSRKPGSASSFHTDMPAVSPRLWRPALTPSPSTDTTATVTAAPDIVIAAAAKGQISAPSSRLSGLQRRSTDARTASLFTPEKSLQTMVSMVSQRTANDAWAPDNIDTSVTSVENSQEVLCNCSSGSEGILDPDECNQTTGQCECVPGYTGLQCEDCEDGYFTNGTSGCLPCSCDSYGAVNNLCDSSGTCECKIGVDGPKCDECHPGFFHFSSTGCRPCQCNNHTSYCHPQSGVCLNCEGNTNGSNCEECRLGFYRRSGSTLSESCSPCPCSNATSTGSCHTDSSGSTACDRCLPRYGGLLCDECSPGFYKVSGSCVLCDCSGNADPRGPADLCHPETGHCFRCINNTTGARCQLCAPGFMGDARAHTCTRPAPRLIPTPATTSTTEPPTSTTSSPPMTPTTTTASSPTPRGASGRATSNASSAPSGTTTTTTQALMTSLSSPTDNTTAVLTEVTWTQFNIIILVVIILVVLLLLGFVGGVYTYREYQNRKLNAPFWTIELKEDNISFSSYHDSIPNADVSGLLEDEANEVAPNGQLALTTQGNCYKA